MQLVDSLLRYRASDLSAYELQRQANIEQNMSILHELGLHDKGRGGRGRGRGGRGRGRGRGRASASQASRSSSRSRTSTNFFGYETGDDAGDVVAPVPMRLPVPAVNDIVLPLQPKIPKKRHVVSAVPVDEQDDWFPRCNITYRDKHYTSGVKNIGDLSQEAVVEVIASLDDDEQSEYYQSGILPYNAWNKKLQKYGYKYVSYFVDPGTNANYHWRAARPIKKVNRKSNIAQSAVETIGEFCDEQVAGCVARYGELYNGLGGNPFKTKSEVLDALGLSLWVSRDVASSSSDAGPPQLALPMPMDYGDPFATNEPGTTDTATPVEAVALPLSDPAAEISEIDLDISLEQLASNVFDTVQGETIQPGSDLPIAIVPQLEAQKALREASDVMKAVTNYEQSEADLANDDAILQTSLAPDHDTAAISFPSAFAQSTEDEAAQFFAAQPGPDDDFSNPLMSNPTAPRQDASSGSSYVFVENIDDELAEYERASPTLSTNETGFQDPRVDDYDHDDSSSFAQKSVAPPTLPSILDCAKCARQVENSNGVIRGAIQCNECNVWWCWECAGFKTEFKMAWYGRAGTWCCSAHCVGGNMLQCRPKKKH